MAKEKDKGTGFEAAGRLGATGANYLLAIAINEYQHHPKLSNCVRDAAQLVSILQEKYGFQPDHTVTLFDQEATAANLYTHLVELSQKVQPQDNVVVYFSGHGFYDRSDRTGHLVPVEAPAGAVWHYFSNANLVNRIRAINSFHTFLIVDSCFSGSLFSSKDVGSTALAELVEGLPSRWALAAGQIETVEDGLHGGHSPFAKVKDEAPAPKPKVKDKTIQEKPPALKDMVFVEGGSYEMGEGADAHRVTVSSFYMGTYAVTFDEYDAFCEATKRDKPEDEGWGRGKRPAIHVSWYDAVEYCNWRSRQ